MSAAEIIDVDRDPREAARAFRGRLLRIGVPLLGVLAIVAAIVAVTAYSFARNREDASALSQDLIRVLDERVQTEVAAFLAPAADAVRVLAGIVPEGGLTADTAPFVERMALDLVRDRGQLASIFAGDDSGNFLMVQRSARGTLDSKRIEHGPDGRRVTWTRRDAEGRAVATEDDPADAYDARSRSWYTGAAAVNAFYWSDIYVFFTTGRLGLTVARRALLPTRPQVIVGGDVELHALGEFLGSLKIGTSGEALIVDDQGRLVASPRLAALPTGDTERAEPPRLEQLGDPLLTQVYDRVQVLGDGRSVELIDGNRHIVAASSLKRATGRDWWLVLVVPEDDFVGFVAANSRRALVLSAVILALALGLAALLAWQGLATERISRELFRRQRLLDLQNSTLAEMASDAPLVDAGDRAALQRLTAALAEVTGARRISVWQLDAMRGELHCLEGFDRVDRAHLSGAQIRRAECPTLFEVLAAGEELDVPDAGSDPRTATLASIYLGPLGCHGLVSFPVRAGGRVLGAVWIEDLPSEGDARGVDAVSLGRLLAYVGSRHLADAATEPAGSETPVTTPLAAGALSGSMVGATDGALRSASISVLRRRAELRQLQLRGLAEDDVGAQVFPNCSVLVLRFRDDVALAQRDDAGGGGRIERLVGTFQGEADRLGVRYVKILNDQIIAVEGFDQPVEEAARMLAEIALAMQDICSHSFARQRSAFAFGLDSGTVMGSPVGFGKEAYNIWGEAVRIATRLAATADRGAILASESSYERLSARYLFRRRGAFYLEQVGEMTTYLLRGRL